MPDESPSLLEDEFRPHYEAWQKRPGPQTAGPLLKALDPVLKSALRTYGGGGADSPTLRSQAKRMALAALPRYEPTRAKLRTHLMSQLQSLRRAGAEEGQIVHVPERVRLHQHRLQLADAELRDRLGRDPSDAELSAHAGLSLARLAHTRRASPVLAEGQLEGPVNDQGESSAGQPAVVSGDHDAWAKMVYHDLHPTDQVIMEHVLGLHGRPVLPKQDVARKVGLTPGAVSQRLAKIQKLLDAREELAPMAF